MRKLVILIAGLALFGAGYLVGRHLLPPPEFQADGLAGDAGLEQAWDDFIRAQRESLELFRSSPFYEDDQERAEAYLAMLKVLTDSVINQGLTIVDADGIPLSPQPMARALGRTARAMLERSANWQMDSRELWNSLPRNGLAEAASIAPMEVTALGSWQLDNDQAMLIEFPAGAVLPSSVILTSLWAMGTASETVAAELSAEQFVCEPRLACSVVISHRDPGRANWLNTGGRRRGLVRVSWQDQVMTGPASQQASARLISFADVPGAADGLE